MEPTKTELIVRYQWKTEVHPVRDRLEGQQLVGDLKRGNPVTLPLEKDGTTTIFPNGITSATVTN